MSNYLIILIIIIGLTILQLIWRITDTKNLKQRILFLFSKKSTNTGFIFISLVCFNIIIGLIYNPFNGLLEEISKAIGITIFIVGISLAIWAKLLMKSSWGTPAQHDIDKQSRLITSGPFYFSRNPIYVGSLLAVMGSGIIFFNLSVLISTLIFIIHLKKIINSEEKILKKYFGNEYEVYMRKTPRYI